MEKKPEKPKKDGELIDRRKRAYMQKMAAEDGYFEMMENVNPEKLFSEMLEASASGDHEKAVEIGKKYFSLENE